MEAYDFLSIFKETTQSQKLTQFEAYTGMLSSKVRKNLPTLAQASPYIKRSLNSDELVQSKKDLRRTRKINHFFNVSARLPRGYSHSKQDKLIKSQELYIERLYKLYATKVRLLEKYRNKKSFLVKKSIKTKFIGQVVPTNPSIKFPLTNLSFDGKRTSYTVDYGLAIGAPLNPEALKRLQPCNQGEPYITSTYGEGLIDVLDWNAYFKHMSKQVNSPMRTNSEQTLVDTQEVTNNLLNTKVGYPEVVFGTLVEVRPTYLIVAFKGFYARIARSDFKGKITLGASVPVYVKAVSTIKSNSKLNLGEEHLPVIELSQLQLRQRLLEQKSRVLNARNRADSSVG